MVSRDGLYVLTRVKFLRLLTPYVYLAPALLLVAAVYLYPVVRLGVLSLSDASTVTGIRGFVGLGNFSKLLEPAYVRIIGLTFVWIVVTTLASVFAGLILALLLGLEFKGRSAVRLLALIPWAIPQPITAILWRWMVHLDYGLVNHLLLSFGWIKAPISFLGFDTALPTAMLMRAWHGLPFAAMTILAALQAVPAELYEAADVDGANRWDRFWHVTLPSIRAGLGTTTIILAIWSITTFDMIWVLTEGGPLGRTEILPIAIYKSAFRAYDAGLASAMAITSLAIILVFTVIYFRWGGGAADE